MNKKMGKNKQIYSPVQGQVPLVDNNSSDSSYEMVNLTCSNTSEEKCPAGQSESDSQSILSKVECSFEKKREASCKIDPDKHEKREYFVHRAQMLSNEMRTLSLSEIFSQRATINPISLNNPFDHFLKCYNLQSENVDHLRPCFASKSSHSEIPDQESTSTHNQPNENCYCAARLNLSPEKCQKNNQEQSTRPEHHSTEQYESIDLEHHGNKAEKNPRREKHQTSYSLPKDHCQKAHSSQKDFQKPGSAVHHLTVPERIDMDQPRSHSVPCNEDQRGDVGLIGEDFAFLRRIYHNREEKHNFSNNIKYYNQNDMLLNNHRNYYDHSSFECEQFKNDVKIFLHKKSGFNNLNPNMNSNKISKYAFNTNFHGNINVGSTLNILFNDIAKDQEGSRFLQKRLDQSDESVWKYLTNHLNILELCTDLFGNYVIQKLIDNQDCRAVVGETIMEKLVDLSSNTFGCRVVQKLIMYPDEEDSNSNNVLTSKIIMKLRPHLLTLVYDANGNHVVQKIVAHCTSKESEYPDETRHSSEIFNIRPDLRYSFGNNSDLNEIYGANEHENPGNCRNLSYMFENECILLAKHKYGCRVLQKLFETNLNHRIVDKLVENSIDLAENQYGNYVLQHIIGLNFDYCQKITEKIFPHLYEYSTHKFASNVIETIIHALHTYKSDETINLEDNCISEKTQQLGIVKKTPNASILSEDITYLPDNEMDEKHFNVSNSSPSRLLFFLVSALRPYILALSTDKYGNYVVQRILETDQEYMIRNELIKNISLLKGQVYAKGIVNKIKL